MELPSKPSWPEIVVTGLAIALPFSVLFWLVFSGMR